MRVCVRDISLVELLMTFRWRWETLAVAYHIWTFVCVAFYWSLSAKSTTSRCCVLQTWHSSGKPGFFGAELFTI